MERPTCAMCAYYDINQEVTVYPEMAYDYMLPAPTTRKKLGACKLNPFPLVQKEPTDWCGHHPDFSAYIENRRQNLLRDAELENIRRRKVYAASNEL